MKITDVLHKTLINNLEKHGDGLYLITVSEYVAELIEREMVDEMPDYLPRSGKALRDGQWMYMGICVEVMDESANDFIIKFHGKGREMEGEATTIRRNLISEIGYSPYCGKSCNEMPRTKFNPKKGQFVCPSCGWESSFPMSFVMRYRNKWGL